MANKKNKGKKKAIQLCVCPKCLQYSKSRLCKECGYKKGIQSVLRSAPTDIDGIPWEDLIRIVESRRLNGYSYEEFNKMLSNSKHLGVRMPNDNKPLYGLKKPRAQTGGYGGIANHAAPSKGGVHSVSGGGVSPK